jgi:hypothetical protein
LCTYRLIKAFTFKSVNILILRCLHAVRFAQPEKTGHKLLRPATGVNNNGIFPVINCKYQSMVHNRIILIILAATPLISAAQDFRFSVFTDPQVTWISTDNGMAESAGIRAGLDAGFEMDYFFNENYAFSTGLSINNLGGKLRFHQPVQFRFREPEMNGTVGPGDIVVYRLQYLNIPLGMKFTTRQIGFSTYYAKLGSTGHINTGSRANISALDIDGGNLEGEIRSVTFSYHFGAGVHYSLGGRTALIGGIEYKNRFVDITTNNAFRTNLQSFALRMGVLF